MGISGSLISKKIRILWIDNRYRTEQPITMSKLGEEEVKSVSEEEQTYIPEEEVPIQPPKKKRTLSEKQLVALQRGREKRLQLAQQKKKEKKTKPVVVTEPTPTPDVLSDTETHVERMVEKFLGRKIKEQAKRSRQVQEEEYFSSVEEEESEEESEQENMPPPPPPPKL